MLSHIWVKSESDLNQISTKSLTSFNQSWYIHNINFYHCFIKNFSKLVKLFTQLIRKNTSFVWNKIYVQAFDNLKKQVSSISILHHFDLKQQAILKINALNYVKDEILSQYDDEKILHSMTFYSKSVEIVSIIIQSKKLRADMYVIVI